MTVQPIRHGWRSNTDRGGDAGKREVSLANRIGILREFLDFLRVRKKLWLTPIVVVLVVLGALILFTSSSVAPFIYTLF